MARELRRLLVAPGRLPGRLAAAASPLQLELEPAERHYLARVLRLRSGDRFAIGDGAGRLWTARLLEGAAPLEQPLDRPLKVGAPPRPRLTLAAALPRLDAEVLVRMACELGIDVLQPLQAERSGGGPGPRPGRLEAIVREAAEQCERLWLPELLAPRPVREIFAAPASGLRLLASSRGEGLPLLDQALVALAAGSVPIGVTLAVGPEGGWSPAEQAAALAAGWPSISLGPTILRVSTAAVAGAAILSRWRLGLTCPSCSGPSP